MTLKIEIDAKLEGNWLVLSKMTWRISQIYIGWNKWIAHLTKLFTHV